jgi:hypothetical protein
VIAIRIEIIRKMKNKRILRHCKTIETLRSGIAMNRITTQQYGEVHREQ